MAEKKATSTKGAAAAKKAEPAKKAAASAKAEPTKAAAKKAEPAKKAATSAKAEPTKTAAKKAEPAKKAATSAKAEPTKTAAKKAEPAKKAATAAKAEPTKTAAKKAEPAKKAATTAKAEPTKVAAKKEEPAKKAATSAKAEPTKVAAKKAEPAKKAATAAKAEPTKVAAKKEEPIKATAKKDVQEKSEAKTKSFAQRATSNKKSDKEVGAALATSSVEPSKKQSARKAPTMVADKKEEKKSRMSSSKSDGGAGATRAISLDKNKKIIIICVAAVACLAILLTMILSIKSCTSGGKGNYDRPYMSTTEVGFAAEYLGEVERNIPTEMKDGGLEQGYPKYGYTQKLTQEQKQAVIAESWQLCSIDTRIGSDGYPKNTFNAMDKDGNLILNGVATGKKLYKHSASVGMYMGDVDNNEPAISKNIYIRPRHSNSYSLTGMFAPAGEVIKIEMSEEDMDATGGILVHIGQALYNKKANNIWPAKNVNRMPVILNSMKVNKSTATYDEKTKTYTAYVGSFLGGPIYIHNTSVAINVKVSGGVRYTHFIHGYTTEEEFKENAKSSAPYFDLEVWDGGVLHSGPKSCAGISTYEEAKKAGVLWEKISLVSNYARKKREGIVFLYDPFVAAGAAVAFPSQQSVNCPAGWMSGSLKVDSFIKTGAWGNMHEYNHNFQGFGVGNGGEVTNNALNLLEYSWFTHISSARNMTSYGGGGLSGWNCYTSATWAADQVINGRYSNGKQGLAIYANLLHNFGQEAYVEMIRNSGGQSYDTWFNACMNTTHNDMTYYYKDLIGYNVSQSVLDNAKSKNYPLFIPMASVYQTGRSYVYDGEKKYFNTQQPYVIKYGEEFEIDLSKYTVNSAGMYQSGSVVIPDRFNYTVKKVASQDKLNGSITKKDDWNYVFKPNKEIKSGKIIVTLEVKDTQGVYTNIDDVDLILEFEQSHEMNKNVVERTTYTYAAGAGYTDAVAAYEAGYAGYTDKVEGDSINKVQNSNTDVWYTNKNGDNCPENGIVEVRGKLHVGADGKYRIALRGRWNIALYIKVNDEENYRLVASSKTATDTNINNKNLPHVDLDFKKDDWVYFKEVMVTSTVGNRASFIGLAFNKFEDATPLFDENGEIIGEVAGDVNLSYAVGYRESYESINKDFETEYHYKRDNVYSYVYNKAPKAKQSIVSSQGYTPYDANRDKIENLVDGNLNTYIHTKGGVSAKNPLIFTVDLGEVVSANKMYINTQYRPNGDYRYASDFILQGSVDGQNFTDLATVQDAKLDASHRVSVDFALTEMRYYRLIITKSTGGNVIITRIDFSEHYEQLSGIQYSIDNEMMKYGKGWKAKSVASSYGHVVVGKKGATVEFTFEGNKLALLSSSAYNNGFEVTIDGKKINTELFKNLDRDRIVMAFLSPQLSQGKHKVKIKCTKKNTALDSIVVWQQKEEAAK